ncbi:hypothetical protein [Streptomyces sp. NPDC004783]|uniref:hypothetical protein n=1 Tax=unclassified Streptomyces TaxID=2593676 RepID=UPI0033AB8A85
MRKLRALLVALAACAPLALGTSPAQAADYDQATPGSLPSDAICTSVTSGNGCFRKYGDQFWVRKWDAVSFDVRWENELWDGQRWLTYRMGTCTAYTLDVGQWGVCNKDFYENSSTNAYGSQGSRLRWQIVAGTSFGPWSSWHLNNQ